MIKPALLLLAALSVPSPVLAQTAENPSALALGAGVLTLTDADPALALSGRVTRLLPAHFAVEGGLAYARPQLRGKRAALLAIEAQLQYHVPLAGRLKPYLGAGVGMVFNGAGYDFGPNFASFEGWNPSISFVGGARLHLTDRIGAFGEMRYRGIDFDFRDSTFDVMAGFAFFY